MRPVVVFRPLSAQAEKDPKMQKRASLFKSSWENTKELLKVELERLGVDEAVIEVDVPESAIRADGTVKLNTTFRTHRVALSFTHPKHGPLRYPCDRFYNWSENVRAIALALEALRAVERYGVTTRGEQYAGWKAIPSQTSATMTTDTAAGFLAARQGLDKDKLLRDATYARDAIRKEQAFAHPDKQGGSREMWNAVEAVKDVLERHHGGNAA